MLKDKILNRECGIILYGLTPPKTNAEEEKIQAIANKQMERIKNTGIDGLILYDIQDESSRTDVPRPFPYMPTLSPDYYSEHFLKDLNIPRIIYKSIGKYSPEEFTNWIKDNDGNINYTVFVGAPSKDQALNLSLSQAYKLRNEANSNMLLGGVTIPERHYKKEDEHLRLFSKIDNGCSFFVSQCVYSVNHSKNLLSDYYYASINEGREMAPIIFTLTPCGSVKTLQFMEWLGIEIPSWLNNDLKHSSDILSKSIDVCKNIAGELIAYSREKNIPIGFNIESVAIRKEEIEASIELLKYVKGLF